MTRKQSMQARAAEPAVLELYGDIGSFGADGVTISGVSRELKKIGSDRDLDVRINSYGGDAFEGVAIYRRLTEHRGRVRTHVDGIAASAASVIAMAGADITIAQAGFVMIHNGWTLAVGNADALRRAADRADAVSEEMAKIYEARTRNELSAVREWMNEETWLSAEEAVEAGFATEIAPNMSIAAKASPDRFNFRHMPERLRRNHAARSAVTQMRAHLTIQKQKAGAV